jgi:two-component system sensor histidine kinase HydH
VAFAFGLAILGGMEDTHYIALMVVPVIAAAFRYTPFGIAVVVSASTVLTFLELWLYYRHHVPVSGTEYFEATNVVLIYVVVAAVVALLAAQLRRDRAQLEVSLEELGRTRDRLVTEEKLAAVGRLASSIAHEIRNPVAMIVSSLAVVNDDATDPAKRRELCGIAGEEARRLESLTTDFLAYALQRAPDRRLTSAATTVGYVADLARARAGQSGVIIETRCPAELEASFDPFQVHQALLNLVVNALEATPEGGRITLGAGRNNDGIEFWVENEGETVPPGSIPRLFEPFFSSKPRGTGLGLAIARAVARNHGGDANLQTNEPGRVRFVLRLMA